MEHSDQIDARLSVVANWFQLIFRDFSFSRDKGLGIVGSGAGLFTV